MRLADEIDRLQGWPNLHFDIEDGNFTPNITFGQKTLFEMGRYVAPRRLDVHLMVNEPLNWLPAVRASGAESVTAHIEALRFPLLFLNAARDMGLKAGLALNLATPWQAVLPFQTSMDRLLVMTSEPDGKGEMLNGTALEKALEAAKQLPIAVYADGGLGLAEAVQLRKAGAAGCVMGRTIFKNREPAKIIEMMQNELK